MKWDSVTLSFVHDGQDIDSSLPTYDFTKLSSINMCPTYGILRYSMHKSMSSGERSMPLEAGSVMHECFAVIRLLSLGYSQGKPDHMHFHGERLLGAGRWNAIMAVVNASDLSITLRNCVLECLATSNFVDHPLDTRRTMFNLETSILYYVQRWSSNRYPVWVRDNKDPEADIGVEVPFMVKVTPNNDTPFYYTGRIDGLHHTAPDSDELLIQENKTASRLDNAWRASFEMSHQVTGYTVAATLFSRSNVSRALVIGLSIPVPKSAVDGLAIESTRRPDFMKQRWLDWLNYTVDIHNTYVDDIHNAPKHTHSCNRYFRSCQMIPFCVADQDEQVDILSSMTTDRWSPLDEKAGD